MSSQLASLKEEIDAKRRFIATLPDWSSVSERAHVFVYEKANHINQLAEQEEEYELLVEAKRIESVVHIHKEMHHPVIERCPLCLDDVEIKSRYSMHLFACPCVNPVCAECAPSMTLILERKCPLCRSDFPESEEERNDVLIKAAENGRPAAQFMVGHSYYSGTNGVPLDKEEAVRWHKLAAGGNQLDAIYALALLYRGGDCVEQSHRKALELMTKAADMGWAQAQIKLASWYSFGDTGLPRDLAKAVHYNTLACNQTGNDVENLVAYFCLGTMYYIGEGGLPESLILAKHYLGRAAMKGLKEAYCPYAVVMLRLWKSQHCGNKGFLHLPGHSVIPKYLYWMRKAAAYRDAVAICKTKELTMDGQSLCSYCMTPAAGLPEQLKQCATCKGAWYCSRNCQVQAWRAGHKSDCIRSD